MELLPLFVIALFLSLEVTAGSFTTKNGITFTGTLVSPTTVEICASTKPLAPSIELQETYIAIGVPKNPGFPRMLGADFYILWPSKDGVAHFQAGIGNQDAESSAALVPGSGKYEPTTGAFSACFTRAVGTKGGDLNEVIVGEPAGYIWSSGPMVEFTERKEGWAASKHRVKGVMPSAIAPITNRFSQRVTRDVVASLTLGVGAGYYYWYQVHLPSIREWRAYDKVVMAETKAIHDEYYASLKK
ncbi:hypothetical protein HDU79_002909 [Rhizoclosmatium sp. JEL0117]|nr:hypothetical protein HDU79_002909 [Rhizoclosmatium sp. JEL0117]